GAAPADRRGRQAGHPSHGRGRARGPRHPRGAAARGRPAPGVTGGVGVVVGGPLARLGGVAARAEAAGFSHVWLHEAGHDAMVAAAVVAGATSRVRVGTDVAVAFARTPTLAAFSA